jgi:hypothetical protein
MDFRSPTPDEVRLLRLLALRAEIDDADAWAQRLQVRNMLDGGMGSLELQAVGAQALRTGRIIELSTLTFRDSDGVAVIATLNGDEDRRPVEVDIWKTDYSRLRQIPIDLG